MEKGMTLLQGMKELKLIEKKLEANQNDIQELSSQPNNEKPKWGTADEQKKRIAELAQSSEDLGKQYLKIKSMIDYTNLVTRVDFMESNYSLNDLLQLRRKVAPKMKSTYDAMCDTGFNSIRGLKNDVAIERYYDEKFKASKRSYWRDFYENISGTLEVVNATTELLSIP